MSLQSTYDFLSQFIKEEDRNKTTDEICKQYQQSRDVSLICYMFCQIYPTLMNISKKYWSLSEDDKSSFALTCLDNIMMKYDSKKIKNFSNFFAISFNREVYSQVRASSAIKRTSDLNSMSFSSLEIEDSNGKRLSPIENIEDNKASDELNEIENLLSLRQIAQDPSQAKFLTALYKGYNLTESGKFIGVNIKKAKKIKDLCDFSQVKQ